MRVEEQLDVVIVGAGISGINAAYRVQTELPGYSYTILEARGAIGGTWDLFRYPGIRSDSDLYTFGFPWRPWIDDNTIADGASIREYIAESAAVHGIDRKIQLHHKLESMDWSSDDQRWTLSMSADGEPKRVQARFIIMSTGYYDYDEPLKAIIPGIEDFKGVVVHPQFWPQDLDYTGKKVVVIGSGATAVTLLPVLGEKATSVTMLQRSPGYIVGVPQKDPTSLFVKRYFPTWLAQKIVRLKLLILPFLFFCFCRSFPNAGRKAIRKRTQKELPPSVPHDPHFNPSYNPWEQRLCVAPDGDFYKALRERKTNIVTDTISTVNEHSIRTTSGKIIDADIIITATGLQMQLAGGARIRVDETEIDIPDKFLWKGVMLQDVPNACIVIGYTNASWTLGADTTAKLVCRLLKHMNSHGMTSAVPRVADEDMETQPVLNLNSTYIVKAKGSMPKAGNVAPWLPRANYFRDFWEAKWGSITTGLQFTGTGSLV